MQAPTCAFWWFRRQRRGVSPEGGQRQHTSDKRAILKQRHENKAVRENCLKDKGPGLKRGKNAL